MPSQHLRHITACAKSQPKSKKQIWRLNGKEVRSRAFFDEAKKEKRGVENFIPEEEVEFYQRQRCI